MTQKSLSKKWIRQKMTRYSYDQILKDISENQNITHKNSRERQKNSAAIYE